MLYQIVLAPDPQGSTALVMAMVLFAAFVLIFHYANFYRRESHWKLAIETWVMIVFITWVLHYSGGIESPLVNLYLLVIITSALTLGKLATVLQMMLIAACYAWLGYEGRAYTIGFSSYLTTLATHIAPLVLVAYVTTMLSADIRRALTQIKLLSETDDLTGVFNKRAVDIMSERVFKQAARYARPCSVLMIDSDSLKAVNDSYGHEAGNRLLKLTVQCIQNQLREADIVGRYGGDEFVVILPETAFGNAGGVAARIRQSIENTPLSIREKTVRITASIGVAGFPEHGNDFETIMKKADQAMYASKQRGKNEVTLYAAA
ncbi:MAG: GGDEF domain-containing protein [Betaproteobacteria bacterium]|nr:GGDEF domain-containing protein [Betaproteobacteria bacterium]